MAFKDILLGCQLVWWRVGRGVVMALKNLDSVAKSKKQQLLESFIAAPNDQNFRQEVVALYLGCPLGHWHECAAMALSYHIQKMDDASPIKNVMYSPTKKAAQQRARLSTHKAGLSCLIFVLSVQSQTLS